MTSSLKFICRTNAGVLIFFELLLLLTLFPAPVESIPLFARRYKVSCTMCHVAFPKLNSFGEAFAGNGYQMPGEDLKEQTVDTGDDKLFLLSKLPLAIRADLFAQTRKDTNTQIDLQGPSLVKLFSSAPLKRNVSYYFNFLFSERGSVAGIEDAFIVLNNGYRDIDLDLRFGQFPVTDILFSREQRLTFQNFTYYTTEVSDSGFKLTSDRAAEMSYTFDMSDDISMGIWVAMANGNGIATADSDRNFDSDDLKNFYGKVAIESDGQSIGFYGYSGRENNGSSVRNEFYRLGPIFNFHLSEKLNIWGNFLIGEDTNPKFSASSSNEMYSWGGFMGATYPVTDDWMVSALYNRVHVLGRPTLDAHTLTANLNYYFKRNFKMMVEVTGDMKSTRTDHPTKTHTGILGLVLAF